MPRKFQLKTFNKIQHVPRILYAFLVLKHGVSYVLYVTDIRVVDDGDNAADSHVTTYMILF